MATTSYQNALAMAEALSREEQTRLIEELKNPASRPISTKKKHSIMELEGLGKEIWQGIDAQEYVNKERDSWDG